MAFDKDNRLEHILDVAMPPINAFNLGDRSYQSSAIEAFEKTMPYLCSLPRMLSLVMYGEAIGTPKLRVVQAWRMVHF